MSAGDLLLHLLGSPDGAVSPQFSGRDQDWQEEEPEHDQVVSVPVLQVVVVLVLTIVFPTQLVSVSNIGMPQLL